jgi:hypothetical protein
MICKEVKISLLQAMGAHRVVAKTIILLLISLMPMAKLGMTYWPNFRSVFYMTFRIRS